MERKEYIGKAAEVKRFFAALVDRFAREYVQDGIAELQAADAVQFTEQFAEEFGLPLYEGQDRLLAALDGCEWALSPYLDVDGAGWFDGTCDYTVRGALHRGEINGLGDCKTRWWAVTAAWFAYARGRR